MPKQSSRFHRRKMINTEHSKLQNKSMRMRDAEMLQLLRRQLRDTARFYALGNVWKPTTAKKRCRSSFELFRNPSNIWNRQDTQRLLIVAFGPQSSL